MVVPSGTRTARPSIVSSTGRFGSTRRSGPLILPLRSPLRSWLRSRAVAAERAEPPDGRLDGPRRRLPQAADRGVPHRLGDLVEQAHLGGARALHPARPEARDQLLLPLGADA